MSNLDAMIEEAKAKGNQLIPADDEASLPSAPPSSGGGAVANYDMSADAFLNRGGMSVDGYVAVKPAGIRLNKDWQGFIDDFEAHIDMNDVSFFMGIQRTNGTNVDYAKSYDGRTTSRGENFGQVVEEYRRTSQKKADPYPGADIPLEVAGDYADPKDKNRKVEAGTVLGLTTSITGFKPWQAFHRKLKQAGLDTSVLKVKVTHSPRKNAAGQEYGVVEFDLIEVIEDNRTAATA